MTAVTPVPRKETTMTTLEIICDQCKQPIASGLGYIHVDKHDAWRVEDQHRRADQKLAELKGSFITATDLPDYEPRTPWEAHHHDCDPHPDRDDYWFDVARANSHAKLLSWTAHLMDKTWLPYTQWATFVRRHLTREDLAAGRPKSAVSEQTTTRSTGTAPASMSYLPPIGVASSTANTTAATHRAMTDGSPALTGRMKLSTDG